MDDLPDDFDAIVIGTGMIESVIAAALSRIGKSVLHLDPNEHYGENWASFNLDGFENWVESCSKSETKNAPEECYDSLITDSENVIKISPHINVWSTQLNKYFMKEKKDENCDIIKDETEEISKEEIKTEVKDEILQESESENAIQKLSRRFNLDLCPKLLFSKGILVQLLITSNIARYAEFKSVSRVLTWRENQLEPVPCSRADVFATKNVSVVQKRILVKILTLFANYTENLEEFKGFENKSFLDYLKHKKLPENLIHYILYAIAMGDNTTPCMEGIKNCKAFLQSLGCYGNTPYIFPMYGSGELPQCFCRLCAVFGGIYCLQRGIEGLIIKDKKCVGVISNKKRLNAKTVILSSRFAPKDYLLNENTENISRGIFITHRSILRSEKDSLTLLQFPPIPEVSNNSVTVMELSSGTCTCPENYFVVHMTTKMIKDAASDLKHVVNCLFRTEELGTDKKDKKPKVLWSCTWNVARGSSQTNEKCPENLKICCSVDSELDYDSSVSEAKKIFKELHPEEEFLPRAPDPDEIILDTEEKPSEESEDAPEKTPSDVMEEISNERGDDIPKEKPSEGGNDVSEEKPSEGGDTPKEENISEIKEASIETKDDDHSPHS